MIVQTRTILLRKVRKRNTVDQDLNPESGEKNAKGVVLETRNQEGAEAEIVEGKLIFILPAPTE